MIQYILDLLKNNQFFSAAFVISLMTGLFMLLKPHLISLGEKIKFSMISRVTVYKYDPIFSYFEQWLILTHSNKFRDIEGSLLKRWSYDANALFYESDTDKIGVDDLSFRINEMNFFIRYDGKILFIRKTKEKLESAKDVINLYNDCYEIYCMGDKNPMIRMLIQSVKTINQKKDGKIIYKTFDTNGFANKEKSIPVRSLDTIFINESQKQMVIDDLSRFVDSKEWYVKRGIFYKRGYLFDGDPGNGKTSFALAIASFLQRKLYSINLNSMESDDALQTAFLNIDHNSVLLLEDIDASFDGRKNIRDGSKISFSALLNCLDGLNYSEGLIVIITTNHKTKLDPALLRKGRCDMHVTITNPAPELIVSYVKKWYNITHDVKDVLSSVNYCMADVQNICLSNNSYANAISELKYGKSIKSIEGSGVSSVSAS